MIQDGMWRGRRAFIIGGGPSLEGFNFSVLSGELTLGINMAFLHNPTVNIIFDLRLMQRLAGDPRWDAYKGEKVWLNYEVPGQSYSFPGVTELREALDGYEPVWSRTLRDGLYRKTNAGPSAINLAEILGADPIYLLGFDFTGSKARANWHQEYPEEWRADPGTYNVYLRDFQEQAPNIKAHVYNLNPLSRLRVFPFANLEDIL